VTGILEAHLRSRRESGRKLLVPYVTGGISADWLDTLRAIVAAGADTVEIGIPFSDPVMDGPVIQEASQRALDGGATPAGILQQLRDVDAGVPLVAMTYYNLVFHTGFERWSNQLVEGDVRGVILPDVPLEELGDWRAAAGKAGVETILLAAPITPDDRLARLCEEAEGFVYGVNLMGTTGERGSVAESSAVLAKRLKAVTDKPVIMGFGISTPDQAVAAAAESDGVVVASALMRRVLEGAGPAEVYDFVSALRTALDRG
jgi:tryptophan synthase alpha chain